jgi:L-carnitine CoA-transferase
MTYADLLATDHWNMRESFTSWQSNHGFEMKGVSPMPKMKNRPGQVWRGAPGLGMDNEEVLTELGYSEDEIAAMYEKGIINKRPVEDFRQ